jgi:hypothetical protein
MLLGTYCLEPNDHFINLILTKTKKLFHLTFEQLPMNLTYVFKKG